MKRTFKTILCAVAGVMAAVSCQKSIEPANPVEEGKGTIDICVNGLMGEYTQQDGVKSSLVNNVRVAWAAGDVVYVFDGSKYLGKLTAALDKKADGDTDEDRYAKLGGTISAPSTTPCVLSLVHSSLMTEPETGAAVSELSIDMRAQSTATVPFVAYATLKYTGTTITDVVVPFQFATSVIKVNCTGLKANTAIDKATLSNVNTVCKLTLSGDGAPTVSGVTNGTITRTDDEYFAAGKINAEGEAVFQIAVPALETASDARVLTVEQGSYKFKDKKFTTNSLAAATSVNTVCQLVGPPVGALPGVFTVSDPDGTPNSGDEKQVYFSKGNLWANSDNVLHFEDAQWKSTPASDGSKDANHVSHFTWSDKVADAVGDSYSGSNLFCDKANKQSVDGSDPIYYALSTEEWQYLFNYGDSTSEIRENKCRWATVNEVGGYVIAPDDFTGTLKESYADDVKLETAGNLVFLPAAGRRDGFLVYNVGDNGYYWSSTARGGDYAYYVDFDSDGVIPGILDDRDCGFSVRLITECQ